MAPEIQKFLYSHPGKCSRLVANSPLWGPRLVATLPSSTPDSQSHLLFAFPHPRGNRKRSMERYNLVLSFHSLEVARVAFTHIPSSSSNMAAPSQLQRGLGNIVQLHAQLHTRRGTGFGKELAISATRKENTHT